ncbi:hypothetical protein [Gulosibacter faecalis]|uniref:Uncharacterized protein n=1 Tax=Gulosibacter faecalis TaxID=272240 RepID=A0ABW5UTP1_9MICO|nr:hypothetical protein [Gulosibacter faecalis]
MVDVRARFPKARGWHEFELAGSLGGVSYEVPTQGFAPNVVATLDKWPGRVEVSRAAEILAEQLAQAPGIEVNSVEPVADAPRPHVDAVTLQADGEYHVEVRYRLYPLEAGEDTLVLTAIASVMQEQSDEVADDVELLLTGVELEVPATPGA